jgi:hypothetical protein
VNVEEIIAAIILEEEKVLVYCMSKGATDIFKQREDEGLHCNLIGQSFCYSP